MSTVVQEWVSQMPWKLQSILFSALRGPDQEFLENTKQVSKWLRAVSQNNADPSKPYMNSIQLPECDHSKARLWKELEHCPCHFVHHFLDALAIVGYYHPDPKVAEYAAKLHYDTCEEIFHFVPEMPSVFKLRHRDKIGGVDQKKVEWQAVVNLARNTFLREALRRFEYEPNHIGPRNRSQSPGDGRGRDAEQCNAPSAPAGG